jgi:hypothetical protein
MTSIIQNCQKMYPSFKDMKENFQNNLEFYNKQENEILEKICLSPSIPTKVAVKVYVKEKMKSKIRTKIINNEYEVLQKIKHPFIIQFFQKIETKKQIHFLMEYFRGQGLDIFLKRFIHKRLPFKMAKNVLKQLLKALVYLHDNNIYHRGNLNPRHQVRKRHDKLPITSQTDRFWIFNLLRVRPTRSFLWNTQLHVSRSRPQTTILGFY